MAMINLSRKYEQCLKLLTDVMKQLFITFGCPLAEDSTLIIN